MPAPALCHLRPKHGLRRRSSATLRRRWRASEAQPPRGAASLPLWLVPGPFWLHADVRGLLSGPLLKSLHSYDSVPLTLKKRQITVLSALKHAIFVPPPVKLIRVYSIGADGRMQENKYFCASYSPTFLHALQNMKVLHTVHHKLSYTSNLWVVPKL